jgi:diguanylate cyclase (GGDEF)-like protein
MMTDITDALRKERALEENEARYKAFIANSSEAIWCYDMHPPVKVDDTLEVQVQGVATAARLSECNQVLARMIGAGTIENALGSGLIASGSKNFLFDIHHFVNESYQLVDHEIVREDAKGRRMCYQISCMGVVENNLLLRVWGTTKDVTARKRYQERLEYQSTHDSLTKLPNRVKLYKEMEAWLRHREEAHVGALLLIDLDRFKEINDTLGHQVGDHLLQLIGPRLETEIADMPGIVARLGGDEFAIFLPQIGSSRQAIVFGHRVLDALRQEFDVDGFCTEISASIGISMAPEQAQDVSTMMRYADVAMYRAKTEMSGLSLYSAEYDPHSPKRLAMMGELGRAIREDQLCLHFQPKVSLVTRQFYGFEALLRWNHPELGFVPPGDFIPIVELTSLIHPMTAWVLEKSIAQCRIWHDKGINVSVAVNLSARNLLDENIPKQIMRLLREYQLPPNALELEITESSIMTDPTRAMRVLDHLHELGVQLSIDDFGTGYSSLAYLKRLPVQTLKIDNSFVRNMLEDKQDELIVNSTIHLAHNLGLIVVAEGVENEELLQRLKALGCDEAQGYHIGRPMTVEKVDEWIATSNWSRKDPVAGAPHV